MNQIVFKQLVRDKGVGKRSTEGGGSVGLQIKLPSRAGVRAHGRISSDSCRAALSVC
jgi:hypothetical protein